MLTKYLYNLHLTRDQKMLSVYFDKFQINFSKSCGLA